MYFFDKGYAIIQLPEYLLSLLNYLKKKGKNHAIYGNKSGDSVITTQYNKTELNYASTSKSTAIIKRNKAPNILKRVNSLELAVRNIQGKLEEIIYLTSLK